MEGDSCVDNVRANDRVIERFEQKFERVPAAVSRAPGRVEVIGNHTDYNGGSVVGGAINYSLSLALAPARDGITRIASTAGGVDVSVRPADTEYPKQTGEGAWANYVLGSMNAFRKKYSVDPGPLSILVDSTLPAGAGLSSSAALELASLYGFAALTGIGPQPGLFAQMARQVENEFVGVPCGILDQGTIAHGRRNALVLIDCAAESFSTLTAPGQAHFHLFDSGKKHRLAESLYPVRHRECQLAFAALRNFSPDLPNLATATLDMLDRIHGTIDECQWRRARHVIEENLRVHSAVTAFTDGDFKRLGTLMVESHLSSRDLFENSCKELDALVDRLCGEETVYGVRLTGGGFGGAVLALCSRPLSDDVVEQVCADYERRFGNRPRSLPITLQDGVRVERLSG